MGEKITRTALRPIWSDRQKMRNHKTPTLPLKQVMTINMLVAEKKPILHKNVDANERITTNHVIKKQPIRIYNKIFRSLILSIYLY